MIVISKPTTSYVPRGGFGLFINGNSVVLTSKELTQAIEAYARAHTMYSRTVRAVTSLKVQAARAYALKNLPAELK